MIWGTQGPLSCGSATPSGLPSSASSRVSPCPSVFQPLGGEEAARSRQTLPSKDTTQQLHASLLQRSTGQNSDEWPHLTPSSLETVGLLLGGHLPLLVWKKEKRKLRENEHHQPQGSARFANFLFYQIRFLKNT